MSNFKNMDPDDVRFFCETQSTNQIKGSDAMFEVLVDLGIAYIKQLQSEDKPNLEKPSSFAPKTLGSVSYVEAAWQGFKENLEIWAEEQH